MAYEFKLPDLGEGLTEGEIARWLVSEGQEVAPELRGIWNEERSVQAGYVPREVTPELRGDEQAISLWRPEGGLRVLIVPADAWVGTPR
jgi:hypothetical protein